MKLRCLDMCCGDGGASMGLAQAGFQVEGLDLKFFADYPFLMYEADLRHVKAKWIRENFDFVWASPPCQKHTRLKTAHNATHHIDLIPATRKLLDASGVPYVIENVVGAPLRKPILLDGSMFGLHVDVGGVKYTLLRERLFEFSSARLRRRVEKALPASTHRTGDPVVGVYGGHARDRSAKTGGRGTRDFPGYSQKEIASIAMEIDWMTLGGLSQAIPPAYSKFIGEQAKKMLTSREIAA